ncbi:MAG: hypothetical protein ACUVV6_03275 [Thermoplasmatota archaeon]
MVCLMPPQPDQGQYMPPQQPMSYAAPSPPGPSPGPWTKGLVIGLALVGLVLFFVGMMILSSTAFIDSSNYNNSESYYDTIRNMGGAGRVVIEIGGLIATIAFIGGGIAAEQINEKVRVGLISAAVAVIVSTLVVLSIFSSVGAL